jgi:tripartite-type tricarboxylate transporter receptor subunit TctC
MSPGEPVAEQALLKRRPQFDPIKDLEPISNVAVATIAIVVHPAAPLKID